MDYWRREQIGAATGIVSVVAMVVGSALAGSFPQADATPQQIQTFLTDNRTALLWQTFLFGIGAAFGIWFLGSLRAMLRRAEGGAGRISAVVYGGGILTLGLALMSTLFIVTPAYQTLGDVGLTAAVFHLGTMMNTLVSFPLIVLATATTLALLRTEVLPKAIAWIGGAAIAGAGIGTLSLFYESGSLAVGSNVAFFVPFLSISALMLASSIAMIPRLGKPEGITHMKRRVSDVWDKPVEQRAAEF